RSRTKKHFEQFRANQYIMKSLEVEKIYIPAITFEALQFAFRDLKVHEIAHNNWPAEFPYTPDVKFQIGYDRKHIFLHYVVEEEYVKATYIRANENVYEDSCVEFFISLDGKKNYFNFEFNVLGTGLIGFGPQVKGERKRLDNETIEMVDTYTFSQKVNGHKTWEIYIVIPQEILQVDNLEGKTYHANFYKCGDGLPNPHFLSWSPIDFPKPNFHLPEFFGEIKFK